MDEEALRSHDLDEEEDDKARLNRRKANLIWEITQSFIAIVIVISNMVVAVIHGIGKATSEFPIVLSSALFLIVGFYFSRTGRDTIGSVKSTTVRRSRAK